MRPSHRGVSTPAVAAAIRAGISFHLHDYEHDPEVSSYGLEAAQRLGLDPGRVLKTLVVEVDGQPAVALIPVSMSLEMKALADAIGGKRAVMADPATATRMTGYVIGGISPLGQKKRLPTVVDATVIQAGAAATVFVSAGRRGLEIELSPQDLVAVTGAVVAQIAR